MIVTKELIQSLGACQPAIDWCDRNDIYGRDRKEVIQRLKDERQAEWYLWAKSCLFTEKAERNAVLQSPHEMEQTFKVGDENTFDSLDSAREERVRLRAEKLRDHQYLFSVLGTRVLANGDAQNFVCDEHSFEAELEPDTYSAFNRMTGLYTVYQTLSEAVAHSEAAKAEWLREISTEWPIHQKVKSDVDVWVFVE